jgi:ElaB/YqjD/DUF883 family membrane-anchored ribosome-binding protein
MARAKVLTTREQLLADLNKVIVDAEQLLKSVGNEGGEQAAAFRNAVSENIKIAKERLLELEDIILERGKAAAEATDTYVHNHPWQTAGLLAGAGILVGLLLNRR